MGTSQYRASTVVLAMVGAVFFAACHGGGDGDPCRDVTCSGHGRCAVEGGIPFCRCYDGFLAVGLECEQMVDPADGDADADADADVDADGDADVDTDGCVIEIALPEPGESSSIEGRTDDCPDQRRASCAGADGAPDVVIRLDLGSRRTLLLETVPVARSFDTALEILGESGTGFGCSDPEDRALSSIVRSLNEGTYEVIIDGHDPSSTGEYRLELHNAARPEGLALPPSMAYSSTEFIGSWDVSNHEDHFCPDGQVVVGYDGKNHIQRPDWDWDCTLPGMIRTICSRPTIDVGSSGAVDTYSLSFPETFTIPAEPAFYGEYGVEAWSVRCPASHPLMVGFDGTYISCPHDEPHTFRFHCAEALLEGSDGAGYTFRLGETIVLDSVGGIVAEGTPFDTVLCPAGDVAVGTQLEWGWFIDRFGLFCGTPSLSTS